ncbi:MAG: FHA domain-containing protein, partial [Anaerolineae bacterium]|nr:FHA domain-containing protein [Anaerolineae bacterium]
MAYGRLDVFVPDGPIQTFPLTETNVSIGRSAGNTIALENNTISRYHFSLIREDGQVYITDLESANGTYVDGVRLPVNERRLLMDGDEIQIGNLRIIFHGVDDTPTVKLAPLDETTQRIEMALSTFYIDLQGPGQGVAPGAHISAELSITNTSENDERYKVEVSGPPEDWIRIDRPTPLVGAGDTTFVLINFKPVRLSTSVPGDYDVRVRVYPKSQPKDVLEARLPLSVLGFNGFGMSLGEKEQTVGDRFHLTLTNTGSVPLPLSLRGRESSGDLHFRFASSRFTLAPGQQRIVEGEIRPRRT